MTSFLEKASWSVEIIVFLLVIHAASYFFLRKKSGESFTSVYLLSITIKILFSCAFVIIFILADKPRADFNAVLFIVGYLFFTAVEVAFLLLKKKA